ncbi:hypothetical protein Aph01nite_18940 [Acrocarpospora phusangensis]|uniref:Uncharacterized protein n=1 Tax=Acrocarpospora phusangensis TaxID=1070424 RepID=A0A919UIZ7_9ACTN|nr:hypothetical protein [Acrocarpospora phusangensis]GIH23584.1 hypothetical protein Aph01nite_18940 [Acrocarpospora phusangensis]
MLTVAVLQFLLALTYLAVPLVGHRHGVAAQRAADTEIRRQGHDPAVLVKHGLDFTASTASVMVSVAIAAGLAATAVLNLGGQPLPTWILQPILLIAGGFITTAQVFVGRYVQAALHKSGTLDIDTQALLGAAEAAFPGWFRPLVVTRFLLTTAGSLVILLVLAVS